MKTVVAGKQCQNIALWLQYIREQRDATRKRIAELEQQHQQFIIDNPRRERDVTFNN